MSLSHCICAPVTLSLSLSWLSRSSSYTRRLHSQSGNDLTSSTPSLLHRSVTLLTPSLVFVCLFVCGFYFSCVTAYYVLPVVNTIVFVCGCERCLCLSFCLVSSSSYGKRLDDPTMTSASTGTSSAGLSRLNSVLAQRCFDFYTRNPINSSHSSKRSDIQLLSFSIRLPQEQTEKKDQPAVTTSNSRSTTTTTTTGEQEAKQRRK